MEELPCEPFAVVPLICAWRATDSCLPPAERAKLAFEQLASWGVVAFDTAETVERTMEALALAGLDADTALRGAPVACLSPPERACVVCGCPKLEVLRRADATASPRSPNMSTTWERQ